MADKEVFFDKLESARRARRSHKRWAAVMVAFSGLIFAGVLVYGSATALDSGQTMVAQAENKADVLETQKTALVKEHDSTVKTYESRIATLANAQTQEKSELMNRLDKLNTDNLALKKQVEALSKVHDVPPVIEDGSWKSRYDRMKINNSALLVREADLARRAEAGDAAASIVNELKNKRDVLERCIGQTDRSLYDRIIRFGG